MDISYRRGSPQDMRAVYDVFVQAIADLNRRQNQPSNDWLDPRFVASIWEAWGPLWRYLINSAEQFWVAEANGQVVGYARALLQDGARELTDYFVLPEYQSAGIGKELLARAFPTTGAVHKVIIATTDIRAQVRYLKCGVYPRFPIQYFARKPEVVQVESDLLFARVDATPETVATLRMLDKAVLQHVRDADHAFLLGDRHGFLYYRDEQVVGYGYLGKEIGPIALLHEADFPAVLAHAESYTALQGSEHMGLQVPMINRAAVDYLLARHFRLESVGVFFMSNEPFGKFENYIMSSPPFFL
jgi:GNAT superfamily N-acetyltransferase